MFLFAPNGPGKKSIFPLALKGLVAEYFRRIVFEREMSSLRGIAFIAANISLPIVGAQKEAVKIKLARMFKELTR